MKNQVRQHNNRDREKERKTYFEKGGLSKCFECVIGNEEGVKRRMKSRL